MPAFEVYDTVVLNNDRTLVGTIERTSTQNNQDALEDCLIILHVQLPAHILNEFVTSGIPPKGYVFVEFADEASGSALVSEQDITLLSRTFDIGDPVKQDGNPMTGTVLSVNESYILEPVCQYDVQGSISATSFGEQRRATPCSSDCATSLPPAMIHKRPHELIYNVPGQELKRAMDISDGDFVICRNFVGNVEEIDIDIVVALEDKSIVVLNNPDDLFIPLPDLDKPLVSLPEFDHVARPDILVALQGWSTTIPTRSPRPGLFVITNRTTLRNGRWIKGSYNAGIRPQGIILHVRTGKMAMSWLSANDLVVEKTSSSSPPADELAPYVGANSYKKLSDVRSRQDIIIYDDTKQPQRHAMPSSLANKHQSSGGSPDLANSESRLDITSSLDLNVGSNVVFRDTTAAAVKYQGQAGTVHGKFTRIAVDDTEEWDLNEFKIIHITQEATVLWQDGSTTKTPSTDLQTRTLLEEDVCPSDLVVRREGLKQRKSNSSNSPIVDFNEVAFFEEPHDIIPVQVGIVQNIKPNERVATVRWFEKPNIELVEGGEHLGAKSRFGGIGTTFEDVSTYEIMSFPGLARHLKDLAIMTTSTLPELPQAERKDSLNENASKRPNINWVGEIVHLGLDGCITVRLGAHEPCLDIKITHDDVVAFIDDEKHLDVDVYDPFDDGWSDGDYDFEADYDEYSDDYMPSLTETVEYEGGERLDKDSDDENWVSADDLDDEAVEEAIEQNEDIEMTDLGSGNEIQATSNLEEKSSLTSSLAVLRERFGFECPSPFEVLDEAPPQSVLSRAPLGFSSSALLKRIASEHKMLAAGLPKGEIFVRTYESRLDILRCLIIGPADTPYEFAPFLVDLHLSATFPNAPPQAHFHSWTSGLGRVNPNLYEEGKICLSLLNTWPGKAKDESWTSSSTLLQVLVSLQGLVLTKSPFFNEAGFEGLEGDPAYRAESLQYTEKAFVMARGFVKHALAQPPEGFFDILSWLYLPSRPSIASPNLLPTILKRGRALIESSEQAKKVSDDSLLDGVGRNDDQTKVFLKPLSEGAMVVLRRNNKAFEDCLRELEATSGGSSY